jgi:hypothetical protein
VGDDHGSFDGKGGIFQSADVEQGENAPTPSSRIVSQTRMGLLIN